MNLKKLKYIISLTILLGLFSCGRNIENNNTPKLNLAKEFGIDSVQLKYQYYQKFGFTETCEDLRMVSKPNETPKLNKTLPIESNDLEKINNFSNKTDKIKGEIISFKSNLRNKFYDIELEFTEFIKNSSLIIKLNKGKYEITETELSSTLKVFDNESGLLYIESHKCDEK